MAAVDSSVDHKAELPEAVGTFANTRLGDERRFSSIHPLDLMFRKRTGPSGRRPRLISIWTTLARSAAVMTRLPAGRAGIAQMGCGSTSIVADGDGCVATAVGRERRRRQPKRIEHLPLHEVVEGFAGDLFESRPENSVRRIRVRVERPRSPSRF